jgi:hypothetical protein
VPNAESKRGSWHAETIVAINPPAAVRKSWLARQVVVAELRELIFQRTRTLCAAGTIARLLERS